MDSEEEEDDERFYSAEEGGNHVIEEEEEHEVQIDVEDIPDEEEEDEEPGDDVPEIVDVMRLFLDHEGISNLGSNHTTMLDIERIRLPFDKQHKNIWLFFF